MLLIGNGILITRNQNNDFYQSGAVAIKDGVIKAFGETDHLKKQYADAQFIDAGGDIIMPGFINVHEHIYSALARGFSINGYAPTNFLEILDGMWWTIDKTLTLEQVKQSALATYMESIKNGVTTVFDHHASYGAIGDSLFKIAEAAKMAGVRTNLCFEVSDRHGEAKMKEAVLENEAFIKHALADDSDMLSAMMGLHASFTLSNQSLAYVRQHTPDGVGYHIHVAEGIEDLHDSLKKYGKRIVYRLMDEQILGSKSIAVHCIYVNPSEMRLLKETDTMVVHNPESNMGNACGCPPTMEIYRHGVLTGLGTDGYTHDVLESWKVANVLHKHHLCDPGAAWGELPDMLFNANAKIANRYFKKPLGKIETGAAADVIISDYKPYTPINADNYNGHILFGMQGNSIKTTVINGKVVMQDRQLKSLDEEKILADIRQGSQALWQTINK